MDQTGRAAGGAGAVEFQWLSGEEAQTLLPVLFSLFYENMRLIAPIERPYGEEYALWSGEVGPALRKTNRHIVLILDAKTPVGFLMYYTNDETFMIEEAQLKEEYRGKGVMRRLFARLADRIDPPPAYVEAFTHAGNALSIGILTHLGFEKAGDDGGFYRFRRDCGSFLGRCRDLPEKKGKEGNAG